MNFQRIQLVWPLGIISLILAVLSVVAGWSLIREQGAAAKDLRGDVSRHRTAAELEECFVDLVALIKDRVETVDALHERATNVLRDVQGGATDSEEKDRVSKIAAAYSNHLVRWEKLQASEPARHADAIHEVVRLMERELLRPSHELEAYYSFRVERLADEHARLLRRTSWGLVWVGGLGGIAGLAFGVGVARSLSHSIRRLQVQVRDAAGKLDPTSTEIIFSGSGDVSALHDQMESLTKRIEGFVETLQQREREVLRAEQLAALGQLAAGVAHEVRNPLTSIKLLVQSELEHSTVGGMPVEDLTVIVGEVQRMERSLQSFLDYARPPRPERRSVDLAALAKTVLGLLRVRSERQRVAVRFTSPKNGVTVFADSAQMQQVMINLVLNALDAMPQGGTLTVDVKHSGSLAEFSVSDTGPGIAPGMKDRLFEPFATNKETGLGLGLVITRRIVEAHGGGIEASNQATGGAVFHVTLPAGSAAPQELRHDPQLVGG
ncbi:MAG: hypothetical protein IT428_16915 [Planctomycetaceae bacterium]|nr:hypothetical protein [Planctomycetaceae bacterium]